MRQVVAMAAVCALGASLLSTAPAEAATHTTSGLRCTKVGTPHADRIVGTAHRDVICGLGGNDVIVGGGGNDVIDGGAGSDRISAGVGNDNVTAGTGDDVVDAGTGNDLVSTGTGNDRVDAGTGNDLVDAGAGKDSVHGVAGNDRLRGGPGNDVLAGDAGNDAVYGDAGDDTLTGGSGVDIIDGGPGFNWCDVASGEHHGDCAVDTAAPVVREIKVSTTSVDVTHGSVTLTALVHATDDTGLRSVMLQAAPRSTGMTLDSRLVSRSIGGYPRDGWWRFTIEVPRYLASTDVAVNASAFDRVNRQRWNDEPTMVAVVGDDPDVQPPTVLGTSFAPTPVDVRRGSNWASLRARVSDDKSGVDQVLACPYHRSADGYRPGAECQVLSRSSGTALDGWWSALWMVPKGSLSGDWDVRICVTDESRQSPQQCWIGPGEAAYDHAHGITESGPELPAGSGVVKVLGTADDTSPPVLTSLRLSPDTVDAGAGARTAYIDVAARDVEGIMNVRTRVFAEDDAMRTLDSDYDGTIITGDSRNGVWRFSVEVPGGTPPGRYWVQTWIEDNTHQLGWQPARHLDGGVAWQAYTPDQTPDGDALVVQ